MNNITQLFNEILDFANIEYFDFDYINQKITLNKEYNSNNYFTTEIDDFTNGYIKHSIIDPSSIKNMLDILMSLKNGNRTVTKDIWFHFPGANMPKCLKIHCLNVFNDNNSPIYAHCMALDITESQNAETIFKQRSNSVFRSNENAIATFHVNVTKNYCNNASTSSNSMQELMNCTTLDSLISKIVDYIPESTEKIQFINKFSRNNLLALVNKGAFQTQLDHHLNVRHGKDEWVRTRVDSFKNPVSGEIECAIQINSIHNTKIIESLINGIVNREFVFIALAYIKTDSFVMIDRFNHNANEEIKGFISKFRSQITNIITIESERERILNLFSMNNLIENINLNGEYEIHFNTHESIDKNRHYVLHFSFLNNKKEIIAISCHDATKMYNDELLQKKQLEDALKAAETANQTKSNFLSLVSHDIRTPLNGIIGMLQLAERETAIAKIQNYLEKAKMSSGFLLGLINDILDMSKMESGKITLSPEPYTFVEFQDYINSVIKPLCDKKDITFAMHVQNGESCIEVDKLRFNQIFFNLLSNACKYTRPGGNVQFKIHYERIDDKNCLGTFVVSDNGIGMSEEFQTHLFESFTQENRISFNKNEGSGLGLSITKDLVNLMGGEISVVSEIDKFTTITVQLTFPYIENYVKESVIDTTENDTNSHNNYENKVFLLCEDNIINQEIAVEILKNLGSEVEVADNGKIGYEMFISKPEGYYTAIFMDIRMPVMDGLEAARKIRAANHSDASSIPIIAMTANAMSEDKMECIEAGMNAHVSKPIDIHEFVNTLQSLI